MAYVYFADVPLARHGEAGVQSWSRMQFAQETTIEMQNAFPVPKLQSAINAACAVSG